MCMHVSGLGGWVGVVCLALIFMRSGATHCGGNIAKMLHGGSLRFLVLGRLYGSFVNGV
jgi:hypothetical protein